MAEFNSCASLVKDKDVLVQLEESYSNSSDSLQDMLDMQEWLQSTLAEKLPDHNIAPSNIMYKGQLVEWIDRNFDAIMDEHRELKNSIGGMSRGEKAASSVWKKWKTDHSKMSNELVSDMAEEDRLEMLFEMIDIMHFVFNMLLGLGMTSKDIYVLYFLKNAENRRRYENNY